MGKTKLGLVGKAFSDEQLREDSKNWSRAKWNRYLKSLEIEQTEVLSKSYNKKLLRHDAKEALAAYFHNPEDEPSSLSGTKEPRGLLGDRLRRLSPFEYLALHTFVRSKDQRSVSLRLVTTGGDEPSNR